MTIPTLVPAMWLGDTFSPTRAAIAKWSLAAVGIVEDEGDNRSPFIDAITLDAESPLASPYCAIFARAAWKANGVPPLGNGAVETWHGQGILTKRFVPIRSAQVGDVILFDFGTAQGVADHCGIIVRYFSQWVYTVEGNTNNTMGRIGDGIYFHRWALDDPHILGAVSLALP